MIRTGDIACAERSNGSESGFREIDRVHAIACGAGICDGDVDGLDRKGEGAGQDLGDK